MRHPVDIIYNVKKMFLFHVSSEKRVPNGTRPIRPPCSEGKSLKICGQENGKEGEDFGRFERFPIEQSSEKSVPNVTRPTRPQCSEDELLKICGQEIARKEKIFESSRISLLNQYRAAPQESISLLEVLTIFREK